MVSDGHAEADAPNDGAMGHSTRIRRSRCDHTVGVYEAMRWAPDDWYRYGVKCRRQATVSLAGIRQVRLYRSYAAPFRAGGGGGPARGGCAAAGAGPRDRRAAAAAGGALVVRRAAGARASGIEYRGAMLHSKALLVDWHAMLVGLSKLDFRSLWLNPEVYLLMFDHGCAAARGLRWGL
jgi:hypothetical protein